MFSALNNLFGRYKTTVASAPAADREAFLRQIGASSIFVIAAMQGDGIDPRGMTKEQLLAEIQRAAKDLSERQGFAPFVYEADGHRRLPFFTSNDHAKAFCGEYSKQRNRVYPFQLLGVKGTLLAKMLSACDLLVMNDRSPDEVVLSKDDMTAIQRMWG